MVEGGNRSECGVRSGCRSAEAIHVEKHAGKGSPAIRGDVRWSKTQGTGRSSDESGHAGVYDFGNQNRFPDRICAVSAVSGDRYGGVLRIALDGYDAIAAGYDLAAVQSSSLHYGRRLEPRYFISGEKLCLKK